MIFYPIEYFGVALRQRVNQPLGVVGWQGIVPCKAGVMAERLVDMITTRLLDVQTVFRRLDPHRCADGLLAPGVDRIAETVVAEIAPAGAGGAVTAVGTGALRALTVGEGGARAPAPRVRRRADARHAARTSTSFST